MKLKLLFIFSMCMMLSACVVSVKNSPESTDELEFYPLDNPNLPFSDAVKAGSILFLAGKLGIREDGTLAPGGIEAETRQTMENIKTALLKHGASLDRVVKCTIFLADIAEWPAMNSVYTQYFRQGHLPARSAFAVTGLARNARVEIECIAHLEND